MIDDLQRADHIVTISQATLSNLLSFDIVDPEKCSCVPLGVEALSKKENLQNQQIAPLLKEKYILYVGCLEVRKNISHILEAVLPFPDMHLVITGSPGFGYDETIKSLLGRFPQERLHVLHQVEVSDLSHLYESAFATILPSWEEGFGLPILEAMMHGCPMITSDRSANAEIGGEGAILVNPEDSHESIRAIEQLRDDAEFRKKKIQDGFSQAKKYSWTTYTENLYQLYKSLS